MSALQKSTPTKYQRQAEVVGPITFHLYVCCCSFLPSFPCATSPHPAPSYMHEFIRTKTCGDEPSPSVEQNLIGSLVGKPARLTTGYTISLSKHALQLIYIALSYNLSTDPRPTPIAHRGRGRRPACSPAAHMLYSDIPPLRLTQTQHSQITQTLQSLRILTRQIHKNSDFDTQTKQLLTPLFGPT